MKRHFLKNALVLIIITAVLLSLSGCKKDEPEESLSPAPSADVPKEPSPPKSMDINELMGVVNALLSFDEGYEFRKEYAEVWDDVTFDDFDDVVYYFDRIEYETGLFADRDTDTFKRMYFRLLWEDTSVYVNLMTVVGAFLMALEPVEYDRMLVDVFTIEEEAYYEEGGLDFHSEEDRVSSGEYWTIAVYANSLINIYPNINES